MSISLKNHKLVRVLAILTLESMISSRNFSNGSLWFVKLENHELVSLYIYIYICCFKKL